MVFICEVCLERSVAQKVVDAWQKGGNETQRISLGSQVAEAKASSGCNPRPRQRGVGGMGGRELLLRHVVRRGGLTREQLLRVVQLGRVRMLMAGARGLLHVARGREARGDTYV